MIHSRTDWGAQVVYGDTDSLFVALPGRSREQAFKIGNDIADTVTAMNPKPVKLKFEKVGYLPTQLTASGLHGIRLDGEKTLRRLQV
jgi:hypothetical protein